MCSYLRNITYAKIGIISNNMDRTFKLIISKAYNEIDVTSESKVLNIVEFCSKVIML